MKNIPKFRKNKETEGQDRKPQQEPVKFEFHKWLEGVPETEQIEASELYFGNDR